jgi:hypothetical protein
MRPKCKTLYLGSWARRSRGRKRQTLLHQRLADAAGTVISQEDSGGSESLLESQSFQHECWWGLTVILNAVTVKFRAHKQPL